MSLFTRNKRNRIQAVVLKILNNHRLREDSFPDGPRLDRRVNISLVTIVIPLEGRQLCLGRAFSAVTKEMSNTGLSIVLDDPIALDEAVFGFHCGEEMTFLRGKARHLYHMGSGFYQIGFLLTDACDISDFPELQTVEVY
jgi:hypothetical protein